jgi:hypothetical protein
MLLLRQLLLYSLVIAAAKAAAGDESAQNDTAVSVQVVNASSAVVTFVRTAVSQAITSTAAQNAVTAESPAVLNATTLPPDGPTVPAVQKSTKLSPDSSKSTAAENVTKLSLDAPKTTSVQDVSRAAAGAASWPNSGWSGQLAVSCDRLAAGQLGGFTCSCYFPRVDCRELDLTHLDFLDIPDLTTELDLSYNGLTR